MFLSEKLLFSGMLRRLEKEGWYRNWSPQGFYPLSSVLIPWLAGAAVISCSAALYLAFFVVPPDPGQGQAARIAFIHIPASGVSMLIYLVMAALAGIGFAFNARFAAMAAQALAPTGLMLAFLGLWTGCLWGRAIVGSWWVWDLHAYSELAMAILFIGFIGLHAVLEDLQRANRVAAMPLLVGILGVPFGAIAAESWTARHQTGLSETMAASDAGAVELLCLLAMGLGFLMYACVATLLRLDCVILEEECQDDGATPPESSAS